MERRSTTSASIDSFGSTGNSGWSIGALQWDFGQRPGIIGDLINRYNTWATATGNAPIADSQGFTARLSARGTGIDANPLSEAESRGLNDFFLAAPGRGFVDGLDLQNLQGKWNSIGSRLVSEAFLGALSDSDARTVVASVAKLFNQNPIVPRSDSPGRSASCSRW